MYIKDKRIYVKQVEFKDKTLNNLSLNKPKSAGLVPRFQSYGETFKSKAEIVNISNVPDDYTAFCLTCEICDIKFKTNLDFALHSINHNKEGTNQEEKRFFCHFCNYHSTSKLPLKVHIEKVHDGHKKPFKCELCEITYTEKYQAEEHKNYHSNELKHKCTACQKSYLFSWLLYTHLRVAHNIPRPGKRYRKKMDLSCLSCKMEFTTHQQIYNHNKRAHRDQPQHLCDICGKNLSSSTSLKYHKRYHNGEKPYTCSVCSKGFPTNGVLVTHLRVHTGEKPFSCPHCEKCFSQRTPLKIHIRTHTGDKPYTCISCSKGFVSKTALSSHLKYCEPNKK